MNPYRLNIQQENIWISCKCGLVDLAKMGLMGGCINVPQLSMTNNRLKVKTHKHNPLKSLPVIQEKGKYSVYYFIKKKAFIEIFLVSFYLVV